MHPQGNLGLPVAARLDFQIHFEDIRIKKGKREKNIIYIYMYLERRIMKGQKLKTKVHLCSALVQGTRRLDGIGCFLSAAI